MSEQNPTEHDDDWRARWEQSDLRVRLDDPIERATELTRRTLAWFPIRVWRHFLQHNGFLLAAAISYQSIFAIFATLYFAFAIVGLWLGDNAQAVNALITIVNTYIPGLIGTDGHGLVSTDDVAEIARASGSTLAITGAVAFVTAVWTAIGFVTFTRRAVRDTLGLPFDRRNYVVLKARDFLAALVFGVALILGVVLAGIAGGALTLLFDAFGWQLYTGWAYVAGRIGSMVVAFAINAAALAALIKFLAGTTLHWRRIWPGAILGGAALAVLQLGAGILLIYTPSNPLLATFSVFIGFLLWFRLAGLVILVAASWVSVSARDDDVPLVEVSDAERRAEEHRALLLAAQVRLREAQQQRESAPWWGVWNADRALRRAEEELASVEAAAPEPLKPRGILDL